VRSCTSKDKRGEIGHQFSRLKSRRSPHARRTVVGRGTSIGLIRTATEGRAGDGRCGGLSAGRRTTRTGTDSRRISGLEESDECLRGLCGLGKRTIAVEGVPATTENDLADVWTHFVGEHDDPVAVE